RALCAKAAIVVEAYSPLTHGRKIDDPVIAAVAARVGRSPAQVLLRWGIQKDVVVLPKSTNEGRILENADVFGFTLDAAAMESLDALDEGLATGWDPRAQDFKSDRCSVKGATRRFRPSLVTVPISPNGLSCS